MASDYADDDLHLQGNPQTVTGMEIPHKGGCKGCPAEKKGMLEPGSVFDEDDVMSQIYHVLGMGSMDEGEEEGMMAGQGMEAPTLG